MTKGRIEAFSDGVIAIIITIMVLELKVPHGATFADLVPVIPVALSYVLSFIYVGIYWNNHHHMFAATHRIDGSVLWANLHLLFWLSLTPFTTAWMGENHFEKTPSALYGVNLLMAAIAYYILQWRILRLEGPDSVLAKAVGRDRKGKVSPIIYLIAIPLAYVSPWLSGGLYALVALIWLLPDPRIERLHQARA
jgi:uncharacterized membrane protein